MSLPQLAGGLPAHVAEDVPGTGRLDDRDVGAVDQLVEGRRRFRVARVRDDLAVDVDPVTIAAHRSVVKLHRLVADARGGA